MYNNYTLMTIIMTGACRYPDEGAGALSVQYAAALARLRASPHRTLDPGAAGLLFVPFDTTPLAPFVRGRMEDLEGRYACCIGFFFFFFI